MRKIGIIAASALLVMGTAAFAGEGMKCGAGKCGGMKMEKKEKKMMKCGAGKCGAKMKEKKEKKKAMKCGAGKCGSK